MKQQSWGLTKFRRRDIDDLDDEDFVRSRAMINGENLLRVKPPQRLVRVVIYFEECIVADNQCALWALQLLCIAVHEVRVGW
eukprot:CAMPEP_0175870242 /NCGR_PEP_ID=MMETSP0107_2-20121207/36445_1 /TAXON_ID=195067 ORGANISM="Goniomonas pacifica, Strain CCMP1869" /NCGR_SAMPLE_ID=MMETSP0107_2 /ASSEMBLY_ACC=CAM_ASM_000203 /LENGTH=81 /DNA_ID=CAMNT_0017188437 /DNA_START=266 /DNA_END=508 /DNA_ORIENTATION=-